MASDFHLRYKIELEGKFGHEFLDRKLRYANNSSYRNGVMTRKEAYVHKNIMEELKRIIDDSEITEDDALWPPSDKVGQQELKTVIGEEHISFTPSKTGSLTDVNQSKSPEGLQVFYYLGVPGFSTGYDLRVLRKDGLLSNPFVVTSSNPWYKTNTAKFVKNKSKLQTIGCAVLVCSVYFVGKEEIELAV
ncbi:protein mago nashi homolog [Enhydra lutris kenyoni]|uniref:Protein mago nashi homolog n=1 Tax=Enhydra lutris kenyoni TaxID=391180 RepID=A0A2Y9KW59_ENHLU|nr:protein mago nashi homolog [Enhydra lutris kenyoni]